MLISKLFTMLTIGGCVAAAACGSTSPTAPSSSSRAFGLGGAVITGHVNGSPVAATAQSVGAGKLASTTVTVTIVGTDITTAVDGQGNFQLTGVPPGDVTLKFTNDKASATITLQGVAVGDRIHIIVTLNGSSAKVESEDRDDDDDDEDEDDNEVKGVVADLIGTCPAITFTVNGVRVTTSTATKFEDPCTQISNGKRVEVEGSRQPNGSIAATKVELD